MKNFLLVVAILLLFENNAFSQGLGGVPGSYYNNLQKYWWYRYRLVNDFMKIGTNCGESIPAQRRDKGPASPVYVSGVLLGTFPINQMEWGDATIDLGNYISMLATEHRMLRNNGLSTSRTEKELYYALAAFERLDKNAEARCFDIDGTYPCNYNSVPEEWRNQLNGFFVRDDVPVSSFSEINTWGVMNPQSHFNRPGIRNLFPINNNLSDCAAADVNYPGRPSPVFWPHSEPRIPTEESTDQAIQILMGLSLTSKLLDGVPYVPPGTGTTLSLMSRQNIHRVINHISSAPHGKRFPFLDWQITNPVTEDCVFGIERGVPHACNAGGGEHMPLSYAASKTSEKWGLGVGYGDPYKTIWGATQFAISDRDGNFQGTYAALTDSWRIEKKVTLGTCPLCVTTWVGFNNTWNRMKKIAEVNSHCSPHLPYLYRIMNGKGAAFNYSNTITTLDAAPGCGIHNYLGDFSNEKTFSGSFEHNSIFAWQWSGNDLLHEWYSRSEIVYPLTFPITYKPKDKYRDFNGLDYMTLFNLFNLQIEYPSKYIEYYFNSYFKENFSENYPSSSPLFSGVMVGNHTNKLKLNFLEYLSAKNTVNYDGNLTFRGGKVIDLLPGFETKSGGAFLAYIKDYEINCGVYQGKDEHGNDKGIPGESYHYAEITGPKSIWNPGILPQQSGDTTFYPDFPPDGVPYVGDTSFHYEMDSSVELTCEEEVEYFDSLVAQIYASGDPVQIAYIDSLIPYVTFPECDSTGGGVPPPSLRKIFGSDTTSGNGAIYDFNIFPNPSNGHFTFAFAEVGEYDIKIYSSLGSVVFQTHVYSRRSEIVHIDGLANGVYTAEVVNSKGAPNKRIRKIVISR